MAEKLQKTFQAIAMLQQQTQELNQSGDTLVKVQNTVQHNGFEVWRMLKEKYEPASKGQQRAKLQQFMRPGKPASVAQTLLPLERWEKKVMAYECVFKKSVDEDIKIGVFCFMAPAKAADHIYLQCARVDTCPAARRILAEHCEAHREKDEAAKERENTTGTQRAKTKEKAKEGNSRQKAAKTQERNSRRKVGTAALVNTLRAPRVACDGGARERGDRTSGRLFAGCGREGRAGIERLGIHRLLVGTCAAGSVCNLSFAPGVQIHKHDIQPVFAAATGESIVCPGWQKVLLVTKDGWRIRKKFNVTSHPSVPARAVLAFSELEEVGCKLQLATGKHN
eukprot:2934822-Amphidinium_carterae.1